MTRAEATARALVASSLLLAIWCGTATAGADESDDKLACDRTRHLGLLDGPALIGIAEGDLGMGHRACPRSEVAIGVRGGAIIDLPAFYGAFGITTHVDGSFAFKKRFEVSASLEIVDYQYAQNTSIKGNSVGLGDLSLAASVIAYHGRKLAITPYGRVLFPTNTIAANERTFGGEVGLAAEVRPLASGRLAVSGFLGGVMTGAASAGPAFLRGGAIGSVGLQYSPWIWLGIAANLSVSLGQRAVLDHIAPSGALRFRLWRTLSLELAVLVPVAGADRHDLAFGLGIHYRF